MGKAGEKVHKHIFQLTKTLVFKHPKINMKMLCELKQIYFGIYILIIMSLFLSVL